MLYIVSKNTENYPCLVFDTKADIFFLTKCFHFIMNVIKNFQARQQVGTHITLLPN